MKNQTFTTVFVIIEKELGMLEKEKELELEQRWDENRQCVNKLTVFGIIEKELGMLEKEKELELEQQ